MSNGPIGSDSELPEKSGFRQVQPQSFRKPRLSGGAPSTSVSSPSLARGCGWRVEHQESARDDNGGAKGFRSLISEEAWAPQSREFRPGKNYSIYGGIRREFGRESVLRRFGFTLSCAAERQSILKSTPWDNLRGDPWVWHDACAVSGNLMTAPQTCGCGSVGTEGGFS